MLNDNEIALKYGVNRSTVGRWRKSGELATKLEEIDVAQDVAQHDATSNVAENVVPDVADVAGLDLCQNCGSITDNLGRHEVREGLWCASCCVANNRLKSNDELQSEIDINSERQRKEIYG